MKWPLEQDIELRRLHAGGSSASEIASLLNKKFGTGYTRNAILGKKVRLGLAKPGKKRKQPPAKHIRRVLLGSFEAKRRPPKLTVGLTDNGPHVAGIPLMRRRRHQCGWPLDDIGGQILSCGHPKEDVSSPYCAFHQKLSVRSHKPARLHSQGQLVTS